MPIVEQNPHTSKISPKIMPAQIEKPTILEMIEKLKGKLGADDNFSIDSTDEYDNDGPHPSTHVNELTNVKPSNASTKTLEVCGLIKGIKTGESTMFSCFVPPCVFSTENKDQFQRHCKENHSAGALMNSILCETCGVQINSTSDANLLENLFKHTLIQHADFIQNDTPVVIDNDVQDDNPFTFNTAGLMSLAEPPPLVPIVKQNMQISVKEAKLTSAERAKPKKTQEALTKFIREVGNLYKCPHYYCLFTTNDRDLLEKHLKKAYNTEKDALIPCVYCDLKTPWEHVAVHIDIRHGNCNYACSYCLYRACSKEYVFLHQDRAHSFQDFSVIALPTPKTPKKFVIVKIDPKTLCSPYRCIPTCHMEFLFENEFREHLLTAHKQYTFITCGHDTCTSRVMLSKMVAHWSTSHGVSVHQCGYCQTNSNEINQMYHHLSESHQNLSPNIFVRLVVPKPPILLGYSTEAFKRLTKITTVPNITEREERGTIPTPLNQFQDVSKTVPNAATHFSSTVTTSANKLFITKPSTGANSVINVDTKSQNPLMNINTDGPTLGAPLSVIPTIRFSTPAAEVSASIDSQDSLEGQSNNAKSEKVKKKIGLIGYELFRCAFCEFSCSNSEAFRNHVSKSVQCKSTENINKPFACVHCKKAFKNVFVLCEHVQCHGICGNKFSTSDEVSCKSPKQPSLTVTSSVLNTSTRNLDLAIDAFVGGSADVLKENCEVFIDQDNALMKNTKPSVAEGEDLDIVIIDDEDDMSKLGTEIKPSKTPKRRMTLDGPERKNIKLEDDLTEHTLLLPFDDFGKSLNKHLKCPDCTFTFQKSDMIFYLDEERKTYRYTCCECHKRFVNISGLRMDFQGVQLKYTDTFERISIHPNKPTKDKTPEKEPRTSDFSRQRSVTPSLLPSFKKLKHYRCTQCSYERCVAKNDLNKIRSHLRTHFRAFGCGHCGLQYKSRKYLVCHHKNKHPQFAENVVYDENIEEQFQNAMRNICDAAVPVPDPGSFFHTSPRPSCYRNPLDEVDLNKTVTSVELNEIDLDMSDDKRGRIFDLNPCIYLETFDKTNLEGSVID